MNIAQYIDHTLLKPEATKTDIKKLISEATRLGTYSVCVSPSMLPLSLPDGCNLKIAAVCGFPSGKHAPIVKALEAAMAVAKGADEIDAVIDIGHAKAHDYLAIEKEIGIIRAAIPSPTVLKVIIESAVLTDAEIVRTGEAAAVAGADFVKTSTGFHPAGGATVHAVALMAETVGKDLGVKASGGIRTYQDAVAMLEAGATRLGVSQTQAIIQGAGSGS